MSCAGTVNPRPHALDLLFPMRLGELSTEQSLLAGPVTLVGKIVRVVRRPDDAYIDTASLALFDDPVASVKCVVHRRRGFHRAQCRRDRPFTGCGDRADRNLQVTGEGAPLIRFRHEFVTHTCEFRRYAQNRG